MQGYTQEIETFRVIQWVQRRVVHLQEWAHIE